MLPKVRLVKSASPYRTSDAVTSFEDGRLPEWLLMEVLCRLPVKVVFRCKRVSRQWLSLISDPSFAVFYSTYRVRPSALTDTVYRSPWVFIFKGMYVEGCKRMSERMSHFSEDKIMEIMYPPPNSTSPNYFVLPVPNSLEAKGDDIYFIKAVHNGLVLYKQHLGIGGMYICSPMTKQWFPLPQPKYVQTQVSLGFITQVEAGILTSYRVVLIHCHPEKRYSLEFEVFSSESGEWVEHTVGSQHAIQVSYRKKPVFLNEKLHWNDCQLGLIAYDPFTSPDKFRLIDFPENVNRDYEREAYGKICNPCGVYQGLLKYFEVTLAAEHRLSQLKIWVLEDYNLGRWCLQHTIANGDLIIDHRLPYRADLSTLVCFHPYDAEIVYLDWCTELVSYNIRTRRVERLGVPHEPERRFQICDLECWLCFPLVLPQWPVSIPSSVIPKT